jgi:hypothetical protein
MQNSLSKDRRVHQKCKQLKEILCRFLLVVFIMWYYSEQATRLMNGKISRSLQAHTVVEQSRALKRKLYMPRMGK